MMMTTTSTRASACGNALSPQLTQHFFRYTVLDRPASKKRRPDGLHYTTSSDGEVSIDNFSASRAAAGAQLSSNSTSSDSDDVLDLTLSR
jgi:hypothetical protein